MAILLLPTALAFHFIPTVASSASSRIDLSHRHHLRPEAIARSVLDGAKRAAERAVEDLDVDVSSSLLGDPGLRGVAEALERAGGGVVDGAECPPGAPVRVRLSARMNRITAGGASDLFDSLVGMGAGTAAAAANIANVAESGGAPADEVDIDEGGSGGAASGIASNGDTPPTERTDKGAEAGAPPSFSLYLDTLDIGLNDFGHHHRNRGSPSASPQSFAKSLRTLIEGVAKSPSSQGEESSDLSGTWPCPRVLRLDCCGLGPSACRAIGKGLLNAATFERKRHRTDRTAPPQKRRQRLSCLYLGGNDAIGDSGAAALAAALRTAPRPGSGVDDTKRVPLPILDVLDLSSCGIGDAGAEALAMAIRDNPGCVRRLNLSNNRITDEGATALGQALVSKVGKDRKMETVNTAMASIDLSGNKGLGDKGAAAIASAIECGSLESVSIRSSSVRADGAMAFGKALLVFAGSNNHVPEINIDLSGNELGTLRPKVKSGTPYSASLLKSKASATTASYMNFIGNKIKTGLKDAGLDVGSFIPTGESDDDEEAMMELEGKLERGAESKTSVARCGARSFAEPFLEDADSKGDTESASIKSGGVQVSQGGPRCTMGMRQCALDEGAADALAAAITRGRDRFGLKLAIDVTMNESLDDRAVVALWGDEKEEALLRSMAKRHLDVIEALRIARQRAAEAAEAAAARARAEQMMSSAMDIGEDEYSDFGGMPGEPNDDFDGEYELSDYGDY